MTGDKVAGLDVDHFRARVLQDALNEATSSYWLGRAATFEQVGTPECDQIAKACRTHATLVPFSTEIEIEVIQAISEVA